MANYNLVSNAKFQPFSFERYLQPYQMIGEAYRELENNFATLEEQAESFRNIANQDINPEAYSMHKDYIDKLNAATEDLNNRRGTPAELRRKMLNLRKDYVKNIIPIATASEKRQKHIEEQRQLRLQDPTIEFDVEATTTKLDDYVKNPDLNYRSYSGAFVTKRVADAVKNYAESLIRSSDWKHSGPENQLIERIQQHGLSADDIYSIINNKNAFPEISNLIENIVSSTGVDTWKNADALSKVYNSAYEGLYAGLGKQTIDTKSDASYLNPYEQWKWDREKGEEEEPAVTTGEGIYFPNIEIGTEVSEYDAFNPSTLKMTNEGVLTSSELENLDKQIQEYKKKKEVLADPESSLYREMLGYNLSRQSNSGHDMILLSGQLDMLNNRLQKLEEQLEKETDPEKILNLENQITRQKDLILNKQDEIKGFASNVTLRNEFSSTIARLESEKRKIQDDIDKYSKKYGHLSDNPAEAVKLGLAIDNQTRLSSTRANQISFGEDDKSSGYILNSLLKSAKNSTNTNVYEVNDNGKPTSKQIKAKDLPENSDNLTLLYSDYGLMYSDNEGNKYLIKSDDYSSRISEESEVIRRHLTNFSKDSMKDSIMLPGNVIENGILYNERELADVLIKSGLGKKQGNTISATLRQPNGDIIKVVVYDINKSPKIVYSSMYDLEQGGISFSDNKNKYRQFRGAELVTTYINRKPSASLTKDESYIVE